MQPGFTDFREPVRGWRIWKRSAQHCLDLPEPAAAASPERATAPDYAEPIAGWRVWRVVGHDGRLLLASPFLNVAWRPGIPLEAECRAGPSGTHETPELACGCGISASRLEALDWPAFARQAPKPLVVGRVLLWGKVVEGTHGWRAEHGYPERLWVPATAGRFTAAVWRIADGLADYGVDVSPVCVDRPRALVAALGVLADEPLRRAASA